ncbi:GNAT family N-acetyltransferase [Auraticoccus monumenti]|uniref:GNAT family N-acetyltransferase n=1 Tax=Auraticoccus monumenti TaxID=675864 RepID=UPI000B87BD84|nr:hypothetical protein [Auraticoccus monumenti]
MEGNTEAIIRLCFARQLGLADDALERPGRVPVVQAGTITVLRLWETTVVAAPEALHADLEELGEDALVDASALLRVCPTGRVLGSAQLSALDALDRHPQLERLEVEPGAEAARALERSCPPDDVTDVGLSAMEATFIHLGEDEEPRSGSGYSTWAGLTANLGVLTAPAHRRRGLGRVLAGIAANDALDAGLVPVWRAPVGHRATERLAAALGFEPFGVRTTLETSPGSSATGGR